MNAPTESELSVLADLLELDELILGRMDPQEISTHARHLIRHLQSELSTLTPEKRLETEKRISRIRELVH